MRERLKLLKNKDYDIIMKKRAALRALFTKNPEIEARAERAFPTCEDEEIVFYFKSLLKPAQTKIEITDVFPGGLPYMKPLPLLNTTGSDWEYQPDISLKQTLKIEIKEHYKQFLLGKFDKTNIPLYLFLSGTVTGKSRNASEFHKTAINCLSDNEDEELLARIKDAYVFHVSYENRTYLRQKEDDPLQAVGSQMLFNFSEKK
ncbi:crinkler (CRN) family protein, putative [Rhizophagus clarus]|uniref:Crinkler (CRN) family protein, putative n=1 Tax=Rhizophagus clarus TaxID=94130 RepID=A0A8H3LGZ2_9GLOM|nr:crinkler (CRN) family protein, putative [Rhizophagus clarus]